MGGRSSAKAPATQPSRIDIEQITFMVVSQVFVGSESRVDLRIENQHLKLLDQPSQTSVETFPQSLANFGRLPSDLSMGCRILRANRRIGGRVGVQLVTKNQDRTSN